MAKPTKQAPAAQTAPSAPAAQKTKAATPVAPIAGGVDISKLTPEQLANLQKQLKARKNETKGSKEERFKIIDGMLQDKVEGTNEFRFTTRDILNKLRENNLVDVTATDADEIKKIQARKQHLEKKTDEKGNLVHPEGTFGYKQSATGFIMTTDRIAAWFTEENVAKLTDAQRKAIAAAVE